ncbi:BA75_00808T0 [Komagataella pastoris]|uniref:BA75_00808T0 n=1 Tax=Komagataella pastoris TaxID=4922 RepID=A0A1B2J6Q3_PICPA|nr:BA75_00808T0 [Komagataella pastoris]
MKIPIVTTLTLISSCLAHPVYQQVATSSHIAPGHHSGPKTEKTPSIAENPISNSMVAGCVSETFVTSQGTIFFDMDSHRLELTSFRSNHKTSCSLEDAILKSLSYVSKYKTQDNSLQIEDLEPAKENSGLLYFGCKVRESVQEYMSENEWTLWKRLVINIQEDQHWPDNDQDWKELLTEWLNVIMEVYYNYK